MSAVALFAFSLIASAQDGQSSTAPRAPEPAPSQEASALTGRPVGQPAAAGLGSHVQSQAPPDAPPSPDLPQPQNHEIKAVTGNEGGHPHTGGTAEIPIPHPTVQVRPAAPPPPRSQAAPPPGSTDQGRPVGQPAAAGLGSHVQRDPAAPPVRPGAAERAPD